MSRQTIAVGEKGKDLMNKSCICKGVGEVLYAEGETMKMYLVKTGMTTLFRVVCGDEVDYFPVQHCPKCGKKVLNADFKELFKDG